MFSTVQLAFATPPPESSFLNFLGNVFLFFLVGSLSFCSLPPTWAFRHQPAPSLPTVLHSSLPSVPASSMTWVPEPALFKLYLWLITGSTQVHVLQLNELFQMISLPVHIPVYTRLGGPHVLCNHLISSSYLLP